MSQAMGPVSDDEYGVFALQSQNPPATVSSVQFDEWVLWDSGSGLLTCGLKDFDVSMTTLKTLPRMEAAVEYGVEVDGAMTAKP